MEISNTETFLMYFDRIHHRTLRLIDVIPQNKMGWSPTEDSFSLRDLIAHIASINRYMYGETIQGNPSTYHGHKIRGGETDVRDYYIKCHHETKELILSLTDDQLFGKCETPAGIRITTWKWLRAMIEHEIHHRGQIYLYLNLLGIETPPLYGLTSEQVKERSDSIQDERDLR